MAIATMRQLWAQLKLLAGSVLTLESRPSTTETPSATGISSSSSSAMGVREIGLPWPLQPYAAHLFALARQQWTWCRVASSGQRIISSPGAKGSLQRAQLSPRNGERLSIRMGRMAIALWLAEGPARGSARNHDASTRVANGVRLPLDGAYAHSSARRARAPRAVYRRGLR